MSAGSVGPVSGASSSVGTQAATTANSSQALTQSQFFQLLTAQLHNQDPLNPVSSSDFASQMSQLSVMTGMQQLNTSFQQMLQLQQLSQGAALVGKTVGYSTAGGAASGVVQGVTLISGNLQVQINGQTVPAAQITSIGQATASS